MRWSGFVRAKAACAYFFVGPGLTYGLFTSRMPALKERTGANEAELGLVLLALGLSGLVGLTLSAPLVERFSSRRVLRLSSLGLICLPLAALAPSPLWLGVCAAVLGLCIGFADVSMNTQAIQLEQRLAHPCLALMHAGYSLGGVLGAATSALFAAAGVSPLWNFLIMMGLYSSLRPWTVPRLQNDRRPRGKERTADRADRGRARFTLPPLFVILCGVVASADYAAEGTVGEWGALLLYQEKGASEGLAALVYACFSLCVVACRMVADIARTHFEDFHIVFFGATLSVLGMLLVLASESPGLCLVGYSCMGIGMAPIVPILFSRAGSHPDVSPSAASAVVSILAYGGLLLFPPLIGTVAHERGLSTALVIAVFLCAVPMAGAFLFRKKR